MEKIESRVELREVQSALNDCQGDINEQLREFKTTFSESMRKQHTDFEQKLDMKASSLEV